MASRVLFRLPRSGLAAAIGLRRVLAPALSRETPVHLRSSGSCFLADRAASSLAEARCQVKLHQHSVFGNATFQRLWFSSSASAKPEEEANIPPTDKGTVDQPDVEGDLGDAKAEAKKTNEGSSASCAKNERKKFKRTSFSDSDSDDESDISIEDLVKLVSEKEELLKLKHEEIKDLQDKVLRSYAEMENVMERTKREAENSKKFAIQNFAKSLLDVADNLGRASSVVKESFSKIDQSKDSTGAVPLLKTLLEGVEMTEKQLAEVFRKFNVEKFDPINEQFDPNRHLAVFQIPDASKPPGTVAAVLKAGYTLHERIIRPAEVGVTVSQDNQSLED